MKRILIATALIACKKSAPEAPAGPGSASQLEVVPVVAQQLATTVRLPAEITPDEEVALYPRVQGFVEEVTVDRGSIVTKGQLLVRLSAPELAAQRAEAESRAAAAKSTYDRLKAASATPGAIAGHDLEVASAAMRAELARVESLHTLESYLAVRAPFDGVVTERGVHPGALVGPPPNGGKALLHVEKIDRVRVTVPVPEASAGAIADGATVDFAVPAWPGVKFTGTIARVSHAIDPKTRTMAVELSADNPGGKLVPGSFADVQWPVRRAAPTTFVPPTAIVQTTERTFVDRVRDGKIEQVPVKRGVASGELVEVFGDLAAGDQVLKRGSEVMPTGTAVQTRPAAPPAK